MALALRSDGTPRTQCLEKPETSKTRQVSFFLGKRDESGAAVNRMKLRIDSEEGKKMIAARFATVEPVFGNIRGNKQLDRFTLRGQAKVDVQWQLMCMMHNLENVSHYGYAEHKK